MMPEAFMRVKLFGMSSKASSQIIIRISGGKLGNSMKIWRGENLRGANFVHISLNSAWLAMVRVLASRNELGYCDVTA